MKQTYPSKQNNNPNWLNLALFHFKSFDPKMKTCTYASNQSRMQSLKKTYDKGFLQFLAHFEIKV